MSKDTYIKNRRRQLFNRFAAIICIGVFIYVAYLYVSYLRRDKIGLYEVQEGSIYTDDRVSAFIVRDEMMIEAIADGRLHYYRNEGERIPKGGIVYSLESDAAVFDRVPDNQIKLSSGAVNEIRELISDYHKKNDNVSDSIYLKNRIITAYYKTYDDVFTDMIEDIFINTGNEVGLPVFRSSESGIVSYYSDKYDGITLDMLGSVNFNDKIMPHNIKVSPDSKKGDKLFKLVRGDVWYICLRISEADYNAYLEKEKHTITYSVGDDTKKITSDYSLMQNDSGYYLYITKNTGVADYLDKRFITLHLMSDIISEGLKIPNTSITYKDYYFIPKQYLTVSDDQELSLLLKIPNENGMYEDEGIKKVPNIFYSDDTYIYVAAEDYPKNSIIIDPTGLYQNYLAQFVQPVEGVYCTNYGYTQFRKIERIVTGYEYSIVRKTSYNNGIFSYDRIVTDASKVTDRQLIY